MNELDQVLPFGFTADGILVTLVAAMAFLSVWAVWYALLEKHPMERRARMLAAEALHKVAVIAGANELGRRLGERLRDPLLGVRIAGYFDDRAPTRLQDLPSGQNLGALSGLAEYARTHRVELPAPEVRRAERLDEQERQVEAG